MALLKRPYLASEREQHSAKFVVPSVRWQVIEGCTQRTKHGVK